MSPWIPEELHAQALEQPGLDASTKQSCIPGYVGSAAYC